MRDPATVLANLNTKVFPLTPVVLPEGDSSASIQFIQSNLLQAMSQLIHLGERMDDHASFRAKMAALTFQLREEKDNVLPKVKEIKSLKLKVRNQDEAGMLAVAENVSLREQLELREEEVCDLRCAAETFDVEKTMAVSGAIVKMVKTSEAEFLGLPAPSFEGEPMIPRKTEVFPLAPVVLPEGDSSASIQFIQSNLLQFVLVQAMSQLFHLGERMDDHASFRAEMAALTSQLREEKDNVLPKVKEIKALKLKVRNQDEAGMLAAAENVSLREQLERREEEVCDLRCAAETFDVEKTMAVSGAIVPMIPRKTEVEKTSEPAADDPPTDP
ncbi:hypothetical protein HID58_055409 [Brassica napus]|uniref:Uncharacterized protein n=1 Tax=Brassica napus TaxID=3708 RepID=A0ABQ8AKC5_BRANA|nr:hypothetical protein HID58_055409 [Brassica napus]